MRRAEISVSRDTPAPDAWPDATIVVRGGGRDVLHLANVMRRDGSWSVVSAPEVSFGALCASIRHGTVRRATLGRVREAGVSLIPSPESDAPPYHCDLVGLTAARFDAILGPEELNPVPTLERWRGLSR